MTTQPLVEYVKLIYKHHPGANSMGEAWELLKQAEPDTWETYKRNHTVYDPTIPAHLLEEFVK